MTAKRKHLFLLSMLTLLINTLFLEDGSANNNLRNLNSISVMEDPCKEKYKQFNEKVFKDVENAFKNEMQFMLSNKNNFEPIMYSSADFKKALFAIGKKDSHLSSLQNIFQGKVLGEKRLYIFSGQPSTTKFKNSFMGYILYKETDGTNILEVIRKGEKEWEIVELKKKKGEVFSFNTDCE